MKKIGYFAEPIYEDSAREVWRLYQENLDALHGSPEITENDFADMLKTSWKGTDERNFLIYQDSTPVGWLKINGLDHEDTGWISMLVIAENYHRKGVGTLPYILQKNIFDLLGSKRREFIQQTTIFQRKSSTQNVDIPLRNMENVPQGMENLEWDTPLKKYLNK